MSSSDNSFAALGLASVFVRAVADEGYEHPTPIQAQSIPEVLAGRDLLGCAQTGTGKTAAFVLPLLQLLAARPRTKKIRALILAPTRELAAQIGERAGAYGRFAGLRHLVIFGGVGQRPQEVALNRSPDILVATPGRLLDLMQQGFVDLRDIEIFVLDEADRMLDMGFIHDVRKIVAELPRERQTLFFSATMPAAIADLAKKILIDPVRVSVTPQATTAEKVEQSVYFVDKTHKKNLLQRLLNEEGALRTIVFTRTKHGANRLVEQLERSGIDAAAIHGNKSQGARERALEGFREGKISVLVATDLAARGIDVDGITHVVNYELPNVPEQYVHRIGRTARAGATGRAIAFCADDERPLLADIERLIRVRIPVAGRVEIPQAAESRPALPQRERRPPPPAHRGTPRPSGEQRGPRPNGEAHRAAPRPNGDAHRGAPRPNGEAHRAAPRPNGEAHRAAPRPNGEAHRAAPRPNGEPGRSAPQHPGRRRRKRMRARGNPS